MKHHSDKPSSHHLVKKLFLIDGFGAMVSAILLGVVFVEFQSYFGIPVSTLYFLAALPCVFAAYDFFCFFAVKNDLRSALKRIAIANLGYCCLSLGLAFYHSDSITTLGWLYVLGEIGIVSILAFVEWKTANNAG